MCDRENPPVPVRSASLRMHVKVYFSPFFPQAPSTLDLLLVLGWQTTDRLTMDDQRAFLCKQGEAAPFSNRKIGKHVIPP